MGFLFLCGVIVSTQQMQKVNMQKTPGVFFIVW